MPGGTITPTIDGVNNSSNGFKSGGSSFFGTVRARLGAVEEVTVESAGLSGDAGVQVWGTGLGFLQDANITSTTFGQATQPLNHNTPRNLSTRARRPRSTTSR